MRTVFAIGGFAVLLLAAGCCGSTQPLFTPETAEPDLDLAGTWEWFDSELKEFDVDRPVTVKALGSGEFEARWREQIIDVNGGKTEEQAVVLRAVELDGNLYLDITTTQPVEGVLTSLIAGRHLIMAAQLEGDRLSLAFLDQGKARKCAKEANLHLASSWPEVVLDAPTAELQTFVALPETRFSGRWARRVESHDHPPWIDSTVNAGRSGRSGHWPDTSPRFLSAHENVASPPYSPATFNNAVVSSRPHSVG